MFDGFANCFCFSRSQSAPDSAADNSFAAGRRKLARLILRRGFTEQTLDTIELRSFNAFSSGVPVALTGQEGIRCVAPLRRQDNSGAAPATVGGEPFSHVPLGLAVQGLGRPRRVTTREPGDLPERSHSFRRAGRACGADVRCGDRTKCHTDGGRHG